MIFSMKIRQITFGGQTLPGPRFGSSSALPDTVAALGKRREVRKWKEGIRVGRRI